MTLIYNENLIREFFAEIMPPLEKDEVYLTMAQARRKYAEILLVGHDPVTAKKLLRTNNLETVIQKIRQLDAMAQQSYIKETELKIPLKAIVLFCDVNPKSMSQGFIKTMGLFTQELFKIKADSPDAWEAFRKLDLRLASNVHKSNSRILYLVLDVDVKDFLALVEIDKLFEENIKWISETRGGYHVILKHSKEVAKTLYPRLMDSSLAERYDIDLARMTPIPGTIQGGFKVKRIIIGS